MTIIQGYTTYNNKWEILQDKDILKHDILLELHTNKGECDWDPTFGTTIIDKIFQPKTDSIRSEIIAEIDSVINNCPHATLINLTTEELEDGWIFNLNISFFNNLPEGWSFSITEESVKEFISTGSIPL
jgi:phage baseplate assembly protein W